MKFPDPNSKDTVLDSLDLYDDGQKHILLKSLYKLYFTTILLFILLASALMFYSIFSGNNQIVSIIGVGIDDEVIKKNVEENAAQRFLKLSMDDPRSAEEIIADVRNANQSVRF